ncbi:hypothetical protein BL243_23340 [Ralstonia solanacearum]|nr:hypothetical protein CJO74_13735 [Ralstonia solanacearum]OIT12278.1 hypothetical protein BL243_23340 [Ralstonia solanacearum]
MMLRTELMPFPWREEIGLDEDGVGFALRMATMNGLTFSDLARHLASPGHLYLPAHASETVAFMFGCTPSRLREAFVVRRFHQGGQAADFLGHQFLRPYHLRQLHPQLCPACIQEDRTARAIWSICLVTSCPKHGIRLLDACRCGRSISWRRPAIDFCECGLRLTTDDQKVLAADPRELAVSHQVARLVAPACQQIAFQAPHGLPCGFGGLSVDTLLRVLWIFGIVDAEQEVSHPRCASRLLSTPEAAALVCRAFDRLVSLLTNRSLRESLRIPLPALRALYDESTASTDRRFISSLISRLHKRAPSRQLQRLTSIDPQLSLFGDADEPPP